MINANNRITSNNMINHANNRITPTNMINQRNKLMTYFIPRGGRFVSALCAGFSVQRCNQMLLSAVLLLSAFTMMSDAFAQSKPGRVGNLTAIPAGNGQIVLNWTAPNDGGSPITGYKFISRGPHGPASRGLPINPTGYIASGLTNGSRYEFFIIAANRVGDSPNVRITATPSATAPVATAPATPTNLTAVAGDRQITLNWDASDGRLPLLGYDLIILPTGGLQIKPPTLPSGTATTFTVTGLTNGVSHRFFLTARNVVGKGPSARVVVTPRPPTAPGPVTNLTAVAAGDGQVTLSWTAPVDNGRSPLTDYGLEITLPNGTAFTPPTRPSGTDTTHTVPNLTNGTEYRFSLSARNVVGDSQAVSVTATPATTPAAVTNLTAAPGDGQVTLSWDAPDDGGSPLTGYGLSVFRADDLENRLTLSTPPPTATATTYTVSGLTNKVAYNFRLTATNVFGLGADAQITANPATVPGLVINPIAEPGDEQITLSWTAPDDGGSPLTSYSVVIILPDGTTIRPPTLPGSATTYTATDLTNGTKYTFSIAARNAVGNGSGRQDVSATPRVLTPAAVTDLTAVAGDGQVTLSWTAPADDGGLPLTSYRLSIAPAEGAAVEPSIQPSANATTHTVSTGLSNGTVYEFHLRATNAEGDGPSVIVTATPSAIPTAPGRVTKLTAVAGDEQVTLSWVAPADDGRSPLTGYSLLISDASDEITPLTTATTHTVTGLTNGTSYTFNIAAKNAVGQSSFAGVTVTPAITTPAAATNLTAVAGDGQVTLNWIAPDDGGSEILDYEIQTVVIVGAESFSDPPLTVSSGSATTYTVPSLVNGNRHDFSLIARNAVGPGTAATVSATPLALTAPAAVTGLTATAGNEYVILSWTAPVDNGVPVADYELQRTLIVEGVPNPFPLVIVPLSSLTVVNGVTTYKALDLTNGDSYTFSLAARNAGGEKGPTATTDRATPTASAQTAPVASKITDLKAVVDGDGDVILTWTAPNLNGGTFQKYNIFLFGGEESDEILDHSTTSHTFTFSAAASSDYSIRTHTSAGISVLSDTVTPTPFAPQPQPPSQITDLSAAVGVGTITLTWTAPVDDGGSSITDYKLRIVDSDGTEIAPLTALNSTATTHTVSTGLSNGTAYEFQVRATNAVGDGPSVSASATLTTRPGRVTNLTAVAGDGQVTLSWTAPDDGGSPLTGYGFRVNRSAGGALGGLPSPGADATTITIDSKLSNGTEYIFFIFARNIVGDSLQETSVTATPRAPTAPQAVTGLTAVASGTTVTLNWTAPVNDGGSAITDYKLRIVDSDGNEIAPLTPLNTTATTQSVTTGLSKGTTYEFHVRATNAEGDSGTAFASATIPATAPAAITDLTAVVGDGTITLSWTPPDNGGSDLLNYSLLIAPAGGVAFEPSIQPFADATTHTATNLTNGTAYTFSLTAKNAVGGAPAASVSATPAVPASNPPDAVGDLTAVAGNREVTLSWTAPNLNGGTFEHYTITYGGETKKITSHSTTSTTIPDLNSGEEYTFTITATTDLGTSTPSDEIPATPLAPFVKVGNDLYKLTFGPPTTTGETSSFKLYALPGTTERSSLQAGYTASMFLIQDGETKYTKDTTYGAKNPCRGGRDRSCNTGPAFLINNVDSNVNPLQDLTIKIEITKAGDIGNDVVKTSIVLSSYLIENSLFSIPNSQITDLAATAGDGEVELTWTAPNLNGGTFEHYTITYGGETKKITSHSTTSTTIPDLNNGEEYTFTISATTDLGTSTPSDEITATPAGLASQITDLSATAGVGTVTLTWTPPNLNGGTFIRYDILYEEGDADAAIFEYSTDSIPLPIPHTRQNTFTIRTQTSAGVNAQSNAVTVSSLAPPPPSKIINFSATPLDGGVDLFWDSARLNGGTFENYTITYGDQTKTFGTHSTTSTRIPDLNNDEEYTFTITATTDLGTSTPSTATATPAGLASTITDLSVTVGDKTITLTWTAPNLNGGTFEKYEILSFGGDESDEVYDYSSTSVTLNNPNNIQIPFTIRTATSAGDSLQSDVVIAAPFVPQPPSQITDLSAAAYDGGFTLTWTAPDLNGGTFEKYEIFFLNGDSELIRDHSTTSKIIKNPNNLEFNFTISTTTDLGTSALSDEVTSMYSAPQLPSRITDLSATAGVGTITLTWTAPNLNGGTFILYDIFYEDGDANETIHDHSTTSRTLTFPNVVPQTFTIRTQNSVGTSSQSNAVTISALAPTVPINTFVKVGNDEYKLTFGPPSTTGETSSFTLYALPGTTERSSLQAGYTASMFLIQDGETKYTKDTTYGAKNPCRGGRDRSCNTGPAFLINNVNSNVNPSQDLTIKIEITKAGDIGNDVVYTAIVLSSYLIENSLFSITASQITDLAATAGDEAVTLTWTAPNLNGGTFENYTITYGGETKKITSHSTTSTTISNLNNGEEYTFTISATTDLGTSTPSDGITATPFSQTDGTVTMPGQITTLTAEAGNETVTLSWTPPDNGGSDILDYELEVTEVVGGTARPLITIALSSLTALSNGVTSYPVPDLTNDIAYSFSLVARNAHGKTPKHEQGATATPVAPLIPDTEPPVIELTDGDVTLNFGDTYTEPGFTVTDNVDVDAEITGRIDISGDTVDTNTVGIYTITYSAMDNAGNNAIEKTRTVTVNATEPQAVTTLTVVAGDSRVTLNWIAPTDNGGSPITGYILRITGGEGVFEPLALPKVVAPHTDSRVINGTPYTFTLVAMNTVGPSPESDPVSATPGVPVTPDTTPPVIELTDGDVTLNFGDTYTEPGFTVTDNVDVDAEITGRIDIGGDTVDTNIAGIYTITYDVDDLAGNPAPQQTRTVTVNPRPDTEPPVIELTDGDVTLNFGDTYTEPGFTVTDNVDVDAEITGRIDIGGDTVDTNIAGIYTITYDVDDLAGNPAPQQTRTVTVNPRPDTEPPVIELTDGDVTLNFGDTYTEPGFTVTDNVDVDAEIIGRIDIGGDTVDTNRAGIYTITYDVDDLAGNPAPQQTRTVTVNPRPDTTAPEIALLGADPVIHRLGEPYNDDGVTVTDNKDTDTEITSALMTVNPVNINVVGMYTITYNVMDEADNPAVEVTRDVIVSTVPGQITTLTAAAGNETVTLSWTPPDNGGSDILDYTLEVTGDGETTPRPVITIDKDRPIDTEGRINYLVPDLTNDTLFSFSLVARNVHGKTPEHEQDVSATPVAPLIPDTTPPVIELTDGDVILDVGDTYTEPGFTVTDNVDVDAEITGRIDIGGDTVDTNRAGIYTITYDVDDLAGNPAPQQTRTVTIASPIPSANAGVDQSVAPGADVILSGSGTDVKDDAVGAALEYVWTLTSSTLESPELSDENTATARFTAATVVTSTVIYVFTLTVTDSDNNSGTDTVTISVTSEVVITKDIDKQNKVVLPSMGRAIAYQNINAISTRISQVGGATRKNSLGGNTNAVDILKSIERLNKDSSLSAKEALGNSRFAVALDGIGAALWGKIDYQKFKGTDQNVKYDGSLFSSTLGVEGQINNRARLGLALSHTKSDIDYTDSAPIISATSGGDYEIVMLSVNPYISWKPSDDVDLWATLGYGQGDLELILADSDRLRSSDLRQKTAAVGGSGVVFDNGAIELRLKGEALKTRFEVDKSEGIAALALDATRLRVGLEGSHALSLENGASLNSSVELGVRYDSGDGQTGSRGEVGGRLEYSNGRGLTLEGNARVLVGGGTYDEWGLGGLLKFQPSTDGRGISFNLGLGQGSTVSKTEDIWKNALTNKSKSTATHSTASIKLGYGITAPYWLGGSAYGILTPYTEVKLGNSNSYDLGLDWRIDPSVGFKLNLKNRKKSVNSINLEGEIRF